MTDEEIEDRAFEKTVNIVSDFVGEGGVCYVDYSTLETSLVEFGKEIRNEVQEQKR